MLPGVSAPRPRFVVCEDGSEYIDRFYVTVHTKEPYLADMVRLVPNNQFMLGSDFYHGDPNGRIAVTNPLRQPVRVFVRDQGALGRVDVHRRGLPAVHDGRRIRTGSGRGRREGGHDAEDPGEQTHGR